jgi:hypothetical protein
VTYRMGPHTTSDDPRATATRKRWSAGVPVIRCCDSRRTCAASGVRRRVRRRGRRGRRGLRSRDARRRPHREDPARDRGARRCLRRTALGLARQRERFAAYLDGFADEEA